MILMYINIIWFIYNIVKSNIVGIEKEKKWWIIFYIFIIFVIFFFNLDDILN